MKKEDFEAVHAMYEDQEAVRYMPSFFSGRDHRAFFDSYVDHMYRFYDFGMYVLEEKKTKELLGHVGLDVTEDAAGKPVVSLGYLIRRPFRGQGLAVWAGSRILSYAREVLELDQVYIRVHRDNIASLAAAKKLSGLFPDLVRLEITEPPVFLAKSGQVGYNGDDSGIQPEKEQNGWE